MKISKASSAAFIAVAIAIITMCTTVTAQMRPPANNCDGIISLHTTMTTGANMKHYFQLINNYGCTITMNSNIMSYSFYPGQMLTDFTTIYINIANTAMNPVLALNCSDCTNTVVIDGADGLPVELMEFSVE